MPTINLATLRVKLTADNAEYKEKVKESKQTTEDFGINATDLLKGAVAGAFVAAGVAAAKFAKESLKEFQSFDKGIREVFTLMPGMSKAAMGSMKQDVLALSTELGRATSETVPALYQAISAGVPQDNVLDFMRLASDAALGGVTNLETAVDGITSVVNAYGSNVISATEASDLMFTAVKGGKTDFDQLSKTLFNVIPTAASLGLEFGNVTAALATLTAQGTPTSVATTQMRQLLIELSKEGSEAAGTFERLAGKSFVEFIAQGGNLQGALKIMEKGAADSNLRLSDMFSSVEAGNAALGLTGASAEKFASELNAAATAAGSTEAAAEIMNDSLEHQEALAKAATDELKILIGEALEPAQRAWLELKRSIAENTVEHVRSVQAQEKSYIAGGNVIDQLYETAAAQNKLVDVNGEAADSYYATEDAIMAINEAFDPWSNKTEEVELNTQALAIANQLLADGFSGTGKELGEMAVQMAAAAGIAGREADYLVAKYEYLYGAQIEAASGTGELTAEQKKAKQVSDDLTKSAQHQADAVARGAISHEIHADATEANAKAQEAFAQATAKAEAAVSAMYARSGDFFTQALNAEDALIRWASGITEVGGRTEEQSVVLSELQGEYAKVQETILSYESGVKSLGLTEDERNTKLAEQYERLLQVESAMAPLSAIQSEIVDNGSRMIFNQSLINESLYEAADAAGAGAVDLALLKIATGELSAAQAEAALKSAALSEKINQLGQDIASGMDPQAALANLKLFQDELAAADFTFEIEPVMAATAPEDTAAKAQELLSLLPEEDREFMLSVDTVEAMTTVDEFFTDTMTPLIEDEYKATLTADNQYALKAADEAESAFLEVARVYSATITATVLPPAGYGSGSGGGASGGAGGGGYAVGGFTGFGSDTDIAGVVHRNEYVISAAAVDNMGGPAALDDMHSAARSGGGFGGGDTNVTIVANTREAMALAMAEVYQERRSRLDSYMGV